MGIMPGNKKNPQVEPNYPAPIINEGIFVFT